ncbi:anaerobic ribonucleoside-triphosphate reductase activating protein [Thiocystis violacea]|uniref:anaerobic ribonucleoside-triphosphate reductase activating protein n=1 Tax=Thiocystis violacea TaxID=13725 RepID=UPI001F5B6159|nr:anaerobic ribonucleoside-triphosphate reductase activating protein [Thiocystis violacea]
MAQPQPSDADPLRIGGLTRLTSIDYPGELAAVVFCQGCPWRCRYCQNGDLLDDDSGGGISWSEVRGFLEHRVGLLDGVVFSGGEPTAQRALAAAMREARSLGYKIGLHTGGAYPQRLSQLLPLLDWVGLDIKALPEDYPSVTGVPGSGEQAWESLRLLLAAGIPLEVRTTLMPGWTPDLVGELAKTLADAGVSNYCLQACDRDHTLDPRLAAGQPARTGLTAQVRPEWFSSLSSRGTWL